MYIYISYRTSPTVQHQQHASDRIDTLIRFYRMQKNEKRLVKQHDMRTHPLLLNVNYVPSNQDVVLIHKLIASSEIYCEHLYSVCNMYAFVCRSRFYMYMSCAFTHILITT